LNRASGSRDTSGGPSRGIQWLAIAALAFAAASLLLPAVGAFILSAAAFVLGVLARRQLRRTPGAGPSWVSIAALIVGGFVFAWQVVIFGFVYLSA
jgi:hypothetical protein